jgi:hypothetical protein
MLRMSSLMPERMPEVEDRVSTPAANDGSPGSAFNDTVMISVAFPECTDDSSSLNDVVIQESRSLE